MSNKTLPRKATRGNPVLSQELITQTAMRILRTEPLRELTMRRLARELGATPAAVYGYFDSQDELFDAITAQVLAGIDLGRLARATDWRVILREWARAVRLRQQEYPHSVEIMQVRAKIPTRWMEVCVPVVAALRRAGLEGEELLTTATMFQGVVSGALLNEFSLAIAQPGSEPDPVAVALANLSEPAREAWTALEPYIRTSNNTALFDLTIDCVIAGIDATLHTHKR